MTETKSPLSRFYYWEKNFPNAVYLRQPVDGQWLEYEWKEVASQVRHVAKGLQELGCLPGDRVAILSKNCAHWLMADLAIMMAGCVSVPLYPTQQADSITYVLNHSEAKCIFTGKLDEPDKMAPGIPDQVKKIGFPYKETMQADYLWEDMIKSADMITEDIDFPADNLATIIYTSGTTGFPKGVMHTYKSISFATSGFEEKFGFRPDARFFSYLPLSHVAERILVQMSSLWGGGTVSFAESLETFQQNLQEVSPTTFFSVPRLWSKFHQGILEKLPQKKLDRLLSIPFLSTIIKKKIKKGLGLSQAELIGSGAAAIPPALLHWYKKLGIEILEGYGQTENFAYATVNECGTSKIGTVGQPLPRNEIKIDENGEILIKNDAVMLGYYKEPEKTAETLVDGYIKTGDMGEFDRDGFLKITGRVKELFKTDKGKYVAPSPIENKLLAEVDGIEQICVMGSGLRSPIALCVLSERAKKQSEEALETEVTQALNRVNSKLDKHERVSHCLLIGEEWTVDSGLLTPTLKIKRHHIEQKYREIVEKSFDCKKKAIFENQIQLG